MRITPLPLTEADIELIARYYAARRRYDAMLTKKVAGGGRFSGISPRQVVGPEREEMGLRRDDALEPAGGACGTIGAE